MDNNVDFKRQCFHQAAVDAYFSSLMEKDKSLLTFASAGIGVIVSFTKLDLSKIEFILFMISLSSFLITIGVVLAIFKGNAAYMQELINDDEANKVDRGLLLMDKIADASFLTGVLSVIALSFIKVNIV